MARPASEPATDLGKRLRLLRKTVGSDDQKKFALTLGVSKSAISTYEKGDREPTAQALTAYMMVYGVNLKWLLTGEGEMFEDPSKVPAAAKALALPKINPELFKSIGKLVDGLHRARGVRLPPEARSSEIVNAYNMLLANADDPTDIGELESLFPWLKNRLENKLDEAADAPGTGKRPA